MSKKIFTITDWKDSVDFKPGISSLKPTKGLLLGSLLVPAVSGSFKFWSKKHHTSELTDEAKISFLPHLLSDKTGKEGARK